MLRNVKCNVAQNRCFCNSTLVSEHKNLQNTEWRKNDMQSQNIGWEEDKKYNIIQTGRDEMGTILVGMGMKCK